ncbi:hypothetical protein [Bacillus salacetis]|uniref:hypothetical protein n=1 Tax=Bacillus salacetis TaxID=2315464 RepID=UPI00144457E0|nr:hypothetical protein [Bacillus salacetis]
MKKFMFLWRASSGSKNTLLRQFHLGSIVSFPFRLVQQVVTITISGSLSFLITEEMKNVVIKKNQIDKSQWLSVIEAVEQIKLHANTSAPFNLGKIIEAGGNSPKELTAIFKTRENFLRW